MQVCPFEVSKVIESFVFHQEGLPKELKRHLSETEWRILEYTAWVPKSSVYPLLAKLHEQQVRPHKADRKQNKTIK